MNPFRSLLKRLFVRDHSRPPARVPQETGVTAHPFAMINGVAVTKEELDERVARMAEILKQPWPAEAPDTRHVLKLIGYWAALPDWSFQAFLAEVLPPGHDRLAERESPWPDIRRAVVCGWRPGERAQLVAYLRNGHRVGGALGVSSCRFECREKYSCLGNAEFTDGEWIWPEGLPHYVERHGVMLPEEFVASASAREWKIPPIDSWRSRGEVPPATQIAPRVGYKIDHSFWLEWARSLPEVSQAQSSADAHVLERFCLTFQVPETEESSRQLELFEDTIWEVVEQEYGRFETGLGDSHHDIEWVSIKHRDSVVAQVLDGLRRHGLIDRAKLLCVEPDPNNWQRDRDIVVWPQGGAAEPNQGNGIS